MKLYEYQRSRSFIDLFSKSLRFNIFKLLFLNNHLAVWSQVSGTGPVVLWSFFWATFKILWAGAWQNHQNDQWAQLINDYHDHRFHPASDTGRFWYPHRLVVSYLIQVKLSTKSLPYHKQSNFYLGVPYMSHVMRKPVFGICEQQRCRSACASAQSDQRLYCSLLRWYNTSSFYIRNFKPVASLCSWAGFVWVLLHRKSRRQVFLWCGSYNTLCWLRCQPS